MTKEQLIRILSKLPDGTEVYVRSRCDDAYPPIVSVFNEEESVVAYIGLGSLDGHRNYPQKYRGVIEITETVLGDEQ